MTNLAKIRWQCRRGTKELDMLLLEYLENYYPLLSIEDKLRFEAILNEDDNSLEQFIKNLIGHSLNHV
jgi:antitoxin CptB